MMYIYIYIYNF